jgi:ribonuclease HI
MAEPRKKLLLYIDGASRGNPGKAGAGVVICDPTGKVIAEKKAFLGETTNNIAEYSAFLLALEEARAMQAGEIEVYTDSELLAKQWNGEYKVRNPRLKEFYQRARTLSQQFTKCRVVQIPRCQNRRADSLANRAIDEHV